MSLGILQSLTSHLWLKPVVRHDRPLTEDSSPETESPPARTTASTLMRQELQGEGVGIKPVGDRRSYHLQGIDDDSD